MNTQIEDGRGVYDIPLMTFCMDTLEYFVGLSENIKIKDFFFFNVTSEHLK